MTAPEINSYHTSYGLVASAEEDGDSSDCDAFEGAGTKCQAIKISDSAALEKFYTTRFIQMQQIPCKVINKAWVKIVQPRKQAHNPYNGGKVAVNAGKAGCGQLTRPDWWPQEGCPHREPDHIQKKGECMYWEFGCYPGQFSLSFLERLILLVHILRNLYHYDGNDGKRVTVAELQQSTKECFPNTDQYRQVNIWLQEVYSIRREEERYLEGEIGMLRSALVVALLLLTLADGDALVTVSMPDQDPKPTTKKSRAKARANKRRATRTPSRGSSASSSTPPASVQSPAAVASPISHQDVRKLKQEPSVDCNRYLFQADNQCGFPEQDLNLRQRDVSSSANTSFSAADGDYSALQMSSLQAAAPSYLPAQNNPEALNLGFGSMAADTFGAPESFHAKQRQCNSEPFLHSPTQSNDWLSPALGQQCHAIHPPWGFTPIANEQQTVLQSPVSFPGSATRTAQSVSASSQILAQMSEATPYITGPRCFHQGMDFQSSHPQEGLPDFENMQITDRPYHGLQ